MKLTTEMKNNLNFRVSWLRLARSKGVGSRTFIELLKIFHDPEKALEALPNMAKKGGKSNFKAATKSDIIKEMEKTEKFGAKLIFSCDEQYPKLLKEITDRPPVITIKGNPGILHNNKIAIVGSRNASTNGSKFAYILSNEICKAGFTIVSGLAKGIDTSAHKASVNSSTVAVIAGGINNIYPKENEYLYKEIYEKGIVMTEHTFDQIPSSENFPRRNRIISGLSLGVVVVEAMQKSGTLITSRFAIDQGREVFAVPGSPLDPKYHGTNSLIRDGATLVQSADDVISSINSILERRTVFYSDSAEDSFRNKAPKTDMPSENELSEARKMVAEKLSYSPIDIATIIEESCMPSHLINIAILELELAGKAERTCGNKIALIMT